MGVEPMLTGRVPVMRPRPFVPRSSTRVLLGVLVFSLGPWAPDARAQAHEEGIAVPGVVRDAESGTPIRGAFVSLFGEDWGVLTDAAGAFILPDVGAGTQTVEVEGMGYVSTRVTTRLAAGEALSIDLVPNPVVLEGIRIVADRFERRRNATATSVRMVDREALLSTGAPTALDFLRGRMGLFVTTCRFSASFNCLRVRGRRVQPSVYIDEFPAAGGLDQLAAYQPHELYMVEVYGGGRHIRAYTSWFMEYAGERRLNAVPLQY